MSGVEVAGLGIEAYNDGLDPVKSFVRWERELPQLIRKLRNQHVHYAQTIRILLEPITTEFELAELLQEPDGQLWKDKTMAKKMGDRLGDSYLAYQNTMGDIERITKKIAGKLDLDRATELTRNDLEAMLAANPRKNNERFEFRKRVKFGMSKKSIKALLEELDECNKELERFTDKSDRIETLRRKTVKPSFANRLQRIQKYALSLHDTLSACWSCSCQSSHTTSLRLDQRSNLFASGLSNGNIATKTYFNVSFSSDPQDAPQVWSWQAAEILIEEDSDDHRSASLLSPPTSPRIRKTVSFGDKQPPPYSIIDPSDLNPSSLQEIKDLCASIQQFHKSSPCIGLSFDHKQVLRGAYAVDSVSEEVVPSEMVSLEKLLDRPPTVNGRPVKLSKKERYSLALTLASSTLQLNATPWFKDQWCAKDILFHQTKGPRFVDIQRPYVAPKDGSTTSAVANGQPKSRGFQNKNTILLALAVALLELYFGVSAENHREVDEAPAGATLNPWALCAMAYSWADEEQENLSAAFSGAVNHCLRCFNDPSANLQDAEFLQAAIECIVLPLQEELQQFLGKPGPLS